MITYAAILLSRQPLRPNRNTAWVKQAVEAAGWLRQRGMGLISSTGMQTWAMITALASDLDLPLKLYLPPSPNMAFDQLCEAATGDFDLDASQTEFIPVTREPNASRTDVMVSRDRSVIGDADLLLPISVRDGGNMARMIARAEERGCTVERCFQVEYVARGESLRLTVDKDSLAEGELSVDHNRLIHWTRAVSRPWPGERPIDFYRAIISAEHWPRSGRDTLERIMRMRTILASGRNMPGKAPTVSFSDLPPCDVVPLMRWRARRGEMSFEPYGIGIDQIAAARIGIRPVQYYRRNEKRVVAPEDSWRWQSAGRITDWRAEREYRHLGDFHLNSIPPESIVLYCMTAREAESLRARYPYRVFSFLP